MIDGHNITKITQAFKKANLSKDKPVMIIAKTVKGKGVSFIENKNGWHGKTLKPEELKKALQELGTINKNLRGEISLPEKKELTKNRPTKTKIAQYPKNMPISTRKAYGNGLLKSYQKHPNIVVLDAETSNSTFAETFKNIHPEKFFE